MAIITFATACVLGRLIFVVMEKLQRTEYIIPAMLFCLLLSCAGSVLFFANSIFVNSSCTREVIVHEKPDEAD
jgi:hypothetical protein